MPEFDAIDEFLAPVLKLPVGGKTYEVPSPPALVGLRLQAAFAVSNSRVAGVEPKAKWVALLTEDTSTSLEEDALGPVYQEMIADGVDIDTLNHAGMTAYLWVVAGTGAAMANWYRGKALSPSRSTSTGTGEGSTTPTQVSMSGTRTSRRRSGGNSTTSNPAP